MKQQKSTLFDKLIPFFVQATKALRKKIPMTSAFKQNGIQNAIVGKRGMKFIEFTAKMSKFPNFLYFRHT